MALDIIPSNDPRQQLRLRRFFMALASYAIWVALGVTGYFTGVLSLDPLMLRVMLGGIVFSNLVFYLMLRSGLNQRFEDPSMTLAQSIVGMIWLLTLMLSSPQARDIMLLAYTMIMLFGIFQLGRNEFFVLGAFAVFGYVAVLLGDLSLRSDSQLMTRELLRLGVLTTMIVWCAFFGTYVGRLKQKLRVQNTDLKRAFETASNQAQHDELTHTFNRRFIMRSLEEEKKLSDDSNRTFCIAIFDLDHFKRVNDTFGHQSGDLVLAEFTQRAGSVLRSMDEVRRRGHHLGRYGGEEFIIMLPGTSLPGAQQCAERIRKLTEQEPFSGDINVTVSVGLAQYRAGEEIKDTISRADQALYDAKMMGRNQVRTELRGDELQGTETHSETILFERA